MFWISILLLLLHVESKPHLEYIESKPNSQNTLDQWPCQLHAPTPGTRNQVSLDLCIKFGQFQPPIWHTLDHKTTQKCYSWKRHMARKTVMYGVFSNARKTNLNWSLKCIPQDYKLSRPWKKGNITCECDVFTNTILQTWWLVNMNYKHSKLWLSSCCCCCCPYKCTSLIIYEEMVCPNILENQIFVV